MVGRHPEIQNKGTEERTPGPRKLNFCKQVDVKKERKTDRFWKLN